MIFIFFLYLEPHNEGKSSAPKMKVGRVAYTCMYTYTFLLMPLNDIIFNLHLPVLLYSLLVPTIIMYFISIATSSIKEAISS
jgi:hypothetical protein